ncbi:class I SAM-dependent methyltransferase [Apilactobacillus xinyiensis]|uniref:class I SAM-dependent methyltransferase n=1 Tax=Apilactobacillus xinyiensis TaxID=2841032 RepID=UPI0031FF3BFF
MKLKELSLLAVENIENIFKVLDQSTTLLKNSLQISYVDAFIETCNNLLDGKVMVEDNKPDNNTVNKLDELYSKIDINTLDSETVRKVIQMVMIKAITQDKIQANHQITPDTIAFIIGYIVTRIFENYKSLSILDLAAGTGNLLTAIMNQLHTALKIDVKGVGIDNDDSMLSIANINAQLQNKHDALELIHQDSINNLLVNDVDLVVSDLPVGYYPIDENVQNYQTKASNGHSYAHHLLIEQGMNHVKQGGFGIFLVPSNIFETKEAKGLLKWIQDSAYFQGLLNLPKDIFQDNKAQKAILILQKHGNQAKQADQVMIGEFPSFKNTKDFQRFIAEIVQWEEKDLLSNHK